MPYYVAYDIKGCLKIMTDDDDDDSLFNIDLNDSVNRRALKLKTKLHRKYQFRGLHIVELFWDIVILRIH